MSSVECVQSRFDTSNGRVHKEYTIIPKKLLIALPGVLPPDLAVLLVGLVSLVLVVRVTQLLALLKPAAAAPPFGELIALGELTLVLDGVLLYLVVEVVSCPGPSRVMTLLLLVLLSGASIIAGLFSGFAMPKQIRFLHACLSFPWPPYP